MLSDNELMRLYQLGNGKAFDELYERYKNRVCAYLRKHGLHDEEVDEVFQLVFFKLHATRQSFNAQHPFAAWIFTISRTVMIDYLRKNKRWQNTEEVMELSQPAAKDKINIPLSELNVADRELITEKFFNEKCYEDMARTLGSSEQTLRKRVSRVLKKLRTLIEEV